MFCPKCGKSDQVPESYCRQCGFYLPNLSTLVNCEISPEEHLKANTVLSSMTITACFTLAILLYAFFGFRSNTHPLIYVTAGLLLGMGGWHIQTLIRTLKLKKQWARRKPLNKAQNSLDIPDAMPLLDQARFENVVPSSVTEHTTKPIASELPRRTR